MFAFTHFLILSQKEICSSGDSKCNQRELYFTPYLLLHIHWSYMMLTKYLFMLQAEEKQNAEVCSDWKSFATLGTADRYVCY